MKARLLGGFFHSKAETMGPEMFQVLAIVLPILATSVGGVVVMYIRSVDHKMDEHQAELKAVNARFIGLENFIRSELRLMDVRVARIETHLWPESIRRPV